MPRLKEQYKNKIVIELQKKFVMKNKLMVPRIKKVVLNMGLGADSNDKKIVQDDLNSLLEFEQIDKLLQNIQKRKNIPKDQIEKRMALQMPELEKIKLANTTIENNGDVSELYIKLEKFWGKLNIE